MKWSNIFSKHVEIKDNTVDWKSALTPGCENIDSRF
jgi:hypothetical protein